MFISSQRQIPNYATGMYIYDICGIILRLFRTVEIENQPKYVWKNRKKHFGLFKLDLYLLLY
jgi:hypothetical protein